MVGTRVRVHGAGGFGPGTLAEYIRVPLKACAPVPESLDDETAAGLGMAAITAIEALQRADLQPAPAHSAQARSSPAAETSGVFRPSVRTPSSTWVETDGATHSTTPSTSSSTRSGDLTPHRHWPGSPWGRYVSVGSAAGATASVDAGAIRRRQGLLLGFSMTQLALGDVRTGYQLRQWP